MTSEGARSVETVQLRIPARFAFVRLTRLVISGLATQAPFSLDETEDLRIAVDEMCSLLMDSTHEGADLVATFTLAGGTLTFEAQVPSDAADVELDELSSHILAATVDSHRVTADGTVAVARMEKTCAASSAT